MNYFLYDKKNILTCEKVEIPRILKEVGTPAYIYSSSAIADSYNAYKTAFSKFDTLICYAIKANSNIEILRLLNSLGAGADIVSGGELFRALEAGIPANKIVYAGVGKTEQEIESALKSDILFFNSESIEEINTINSIASKLRKKARIAIRVNPDVDPKTHPYISTGLKKNKFGIDIKKVTSLIDDLANLENISLMGIHMHIGSQLININPLYDGIKKVIGLIKDLENKGINIKYLNFGGGLGIQYDKENQPTPLKFANLIKPLLKNLDCKIILEPGRSITGNSGILATKVISNKINYNKKFIVVDAAMNDLMRPSLYDAFHEIIPVKKNSSKATEKVDIVGPICETGDFLARDRKMPSVEAGEFLAVKSSGAYGFSMSSNYNSRPRAAEVLVNDKSFKIIRRRETYSELIQNEKTNTIPFSKLNGSGNDFILIDNRNKIIKKDLSEFTKKICDQKYAVGADGVIFIENSNYADFTMRIFNLDGSEAEMCGNGARCCAKFAYDKRIVNTTEMDFETISGIISASINIETNLVKLKMSNPIEMKINYKISGTKLNINSINTGVPHVVIFTDNLDEINLHKIGSLIRYHKHFSPKGTNVNFVQIDTKNRIKIRTYERGVEGETLACGTGSTAAALIYAINYQGKSPIEVETKSNHILTIHYKSSQNSFNEVYLEGQADTILDGYYYL